MGACNLGPTTRVAPTEMPSLPCIFQGCTFKRGVFGIVTRALRYFIVGIIKLFPKSCHLQAASLKYQRVNTDVGIDLSHLFV